MSESALTDVKLTPEQKKQKAEFIAQHATGPSPFQKANFFQRMMFCWCNPILKISRTVPFDADMLYQLPKEKRSEFEMIDFAKGFSEIFQKHKAEIEATKYLDDSKRPNILLKAIFRTFKWNIL
jgi:hypothetical protein